MKRQRSMVMGGATALCAVLGAASSAHAATYDNTTKGSWIGTYGGQGYVLFNFNRTGDGQHNAPATQAQDMVSLPSYISSYSYSPTAEQYIWEDGTADVRAVQDPANPAGPRKASTSFSNGDYSITLNVTQAAQFRLGVYALDWDNYQNRDIILDVNGEQVNIDNLDDNDTPNDAAGDYTNGTWALFNINATGAGPLTITVRDNQPNGSNNVLSAMTFDVIPEPASASLIGVGALGLLARRRRGA